ncbi:MAG: SprB repeat-containing protein, partial [Saprospiraceae bacterium]
MKSNLPKPSQLLFFLLSLFFFGFATNTSAQLNLNVTVDSGSSTTTCGDNFGAADPHWRVNINNQGWTTYPATNFCYQNTPFLQYSEPYLCPTQLPNQIQVCFRAFEDDGSFCTPSHSCDEIICEDFQVPDVGTTQNYTLALPNGLSSGGQVNFSISVNGIYPGPPNDFICNAIDFGVLNENSSVGDAANSVYTNICGSNDNDPPLSGFANEQGVWFSFTTNNNPDVTYINAVSDPSNFGDDLNIQFALYESDNGNCNGNLNQVLYSSNTSTGLDEFRALECLEPNTTYFLLIDGSFTSADMVEGAFGLEISNNGSTAASDLPCGAEDLGLIPNNGSVTVENQNNYCSSHSFPEPSTIGFVSQRSVWYQFTVPNSGHVLIEAESDPTGFDPIGLQLAAFSSNGGCNGPFSQIDSEYTFMDFDESLELSCLEPGSTIWLLIDGDGTETQGVYNLSVSDAGVLPPQSITEIDPFICDGETYEVGPLSFSTSGFFSVTVNAYNGCDSLITGMLTVLPAYDEVLDTTICAGQTITVGNSVYDATGNYQDILPTVGGCDSIINTTLVVTGNLTVTATQTVQATNYQIADGAATANAMGGAGNLTYEWSDGQTGTAANNLEGGTNYCVTVTDDLGCSAEDCLLVLFPSNIIPNVVDVLLDCPGDVDGTLNLSVSNGAAPYGYSWENTTDNSINGNGAIPTEGGTATINSLAAGTYSFTVSDAFGLTVTEATITEPAPIITNLNPVLCNGEILSVGMSNVNTSGPFSVTVPSFLGCDSTISGVLTILDPIASTINETLCFGESLTVGNVNYNSSGPISEVIPAFNGCDSTITGNLTILPQILTTIDTTICFGENLAVNGISYEQSTIFSETIPAQNGCDSIINVDLEVLDEIISNSSLTNEASGPGLSDGAAAVNPSGGNGNYSYLWSTGATTANVNALLAGEQVCVTITDNLGCEIIDCLLVTFPSNIELSIENDTLNCFGDVDGSLLLDIEFGIAPYQYVWQNTANTLNGSGTVNTQNADALLSGLLPGTYSVTVTDAIGEAIAQALVVEPLLLTASSSNNPASCFEECDGTASVSISGGIAPYQYFWPNG